MSNLKSQTLYFLNIDLKGNYGWTSVSLVEQFHQCVKLQDVLDAK